MSHKKPNQKLMIRIFYCIVFIIIAILIITINNNEQLILSNIMMTYFVWVMVSIIIALCALKYLDISETLSNINFNVPYIKLIKKWMLLNNRNSLVSDSTYSNFINLLQKLPVSRYGYNIAVDGNGQLLITINIFTNELIDDRVISYDIFKLVVGNNNNCFILYNNKTKPDNVLSYSFNISDFDKNFKNILNLDKSETGLNIFE